MKRPLSMKRRRNVPAIVGFLAVVAFAAARFWAVRPELADVSQLSPHDLFEIFFYAAVVVAIFLLLVWAVGSLWRRVRRGAAVAVPASSSPQGMKIALAALSVVLGMAAEALTAMQTPGMFAMVMILSTLHLRGLRFIPVYFLGGILLDGALCFAVLWGFYLFWRRVA